MSKTDLWSVIGRARCDLDFSGKLSLDFDKTIQDGGYQLDADEVTRAKAVVATLFPNPGRSEMPMTPQSVQMGPGEQAQMVKIRMEQLQRNDQFNAYMVETVKETFQHASSTYRTITWMNWLTFGTGIALFAFSAVYALYAQTKEYALLFAGLGASSFVTSFVLRTPEQTQAALSNLVKTEIAFMSYFDQETLWGWYAQIPGANSLGPDPANLEKASDGLMQRTRETMQLLDLYVAARVAPSADQKDSV